MYTKAERPPLEDPALTTLKVFKLNSLFNKWYCSNIRESWLLNTSLSNLNIITLKGFNPSWWSKGKIFPVKGKSSLNSNPFYV